MSDFKLPLTVLLSIVVAFLSSAALAEETGYYVFGSARYFGPKYDTEKVNHSVDANNRSASRYYPNMSKHLFFYLKNNSRTVKDVISYGDWGKEYRVITGFEYDYKHNKASSSNYGYHDKSGTLVVLGDKKFADGYLRLGGGVTVTRYNSVYFNGSRQDDDNFAGILYAVYNDATNQIRMRSRLTTGFGRSQTKRLALADSDTNRYTDKVSNWFYGFENDFSKTFHRGNLFFQPQVELNGLFIDRGRVSESGNPIGTIRMKKNALTYWEGIFTPYFGIKGVDGFDNKYSLKIGPGFSRILADPYDKFYAFEKKSAELFLYKNRQDERDYITWKLVGSYVSPSGWGVSGELRYYHKDKDSAAAMLGIGYRF